MSLSSEVLVKLLDHKKVKTVMGDYENQRQSHNSKVDNPLLAYAAVVVHGRISYYLDNLQSKTANKDEFMGRLAHQLGWAWEEAQLLINPENHPEFIYAHGQTYLGTNGKTLQDRLIGIQGLSARALGLTLQQAIFLREDTDNKLWYALTTVIQVLVDMLFVGEKAMVSNQGDKIPTYFLSQFNNISFFLGKIVEKNYDFAIHNKRALTLLETQYQGAR